MLLHHRFGLRHLRRTGDVLSNAPAFPYDDPAWDDTADAFGKSETRDLLQEITEIWTDETADYLFFSCLLHQGTTYSATFLALPHVIALAETEPAARRRTMSVFLGGVALHGQLPATSGGVSLAEGDPWATTPTGRRATEVFRASLPQIANLCETSYREDPNQWHAAGVAAALGHLALAYRLESGTGAHVKCPACGQVFAWQIFGDRTALYPDSLALDDIRSGRPDHAVSFAEPCPEATETVALRRRLGPLDPETAAILANYTSTAPCPACGTSCAPLMIR